MGGGGGGGGGGEEDGDMLTTSGHCSYAMWSAVTVCFSLEAEGRGKPYRRLHKKSRSTSLKGENLS